MYRFGDGTPFPLRENFIETLVAAVDCCVALYQVELALEDGHIRLREARKTAADELKRLDALKGLLETAIAPLSAKKSDRATRASEVAASRIFEAASTIIRQSRAGVVKRRDLVVREGVPASLHDGVDQAIAGFFLHHHLPRTEWRVHWRATPEGEATAEIGTQATSDLDLDFRARIPDGSMWTHAVPLTQLITGGPIETLVDCGQGRPRTVRIDTYVLTELQIAPGRETFVLRESSRRASPGFHVVMPRPGEPAPVLVALDKRDQSRGQPFYLDEPGNRALYALWAALDERLPDLVAMRHEATAIRFGHQPASQAEHPAQIAETILMDLAGLVREMRMRSRVPGELVLKRDLGEDRREEMFVPRQVLCAKIESLPPRHRQLFEAIGLSNEATYEFVTRIQARPGSKGPARTAPPQPPPGAPQAAPRAAPNQPTHVPLKPQQLKRPRAVGSVPPAPTLPTVESYGYGRAPELVGRTGERPRSQPPGPGEARGDGDGDGESGFGGNTETEATRPLASQVSGIIEAISA